MLKGNIFNDAGENFSMVMIIVMCKSAVLLLTGECVHVKLVRCSNKKKVLIFGFIWYH